MSDDTRRVRARITQVDFPAPDGMAVVSAVAVENENHHFRSIMPANRLPEFNNGLVYTIQGGRIVGEPQPDEAP